MIKTLLILTVLILAVFSQAEAKPRTQPERAYQQAHCDGQREVRMPDGTRCDCLTSTHAIEIDFANKWYEAIGQSLNYAFQTNKRAGIILILETAKDRKYYIRLQSVIDHYKLPIDVWTVGGGAY